MVVVCSLPFLRFSMHATVLEVALCSIFGFLFFVVVLVLSSGAVFQAVLSFLVTYAHGCSQVF